MRYWTPWMAASADLELSWRSAGRSPRQRRRGRGLLSRKKSRRRSGTASSPGRAASSISTTASADRIRRSTLCAIRHYAAERAAVTETNALIEQLAPVLNSPFDDGFVSVNSSVRAAAHYYQGEHYVFAGATVNGAATAPDTFTLAGIDQRHGHSYQ